MDSEAFKALQEKPVPPLSSLHTKVLMRLLRVLRRGRSNRWSRLPDDKPLVLNPLFVSRDSLYEAAWDKGYTFEQVKAELDTREHIPNKVEAKKIRQQRNKR